MIPELDQPEDKERVDWIEKYVVMIDYTIKDEEPLFRMMYTTDDEYHLLMTDGPSLRAAIDRAMLSSHASQS